MDITCNNFENTFTLKYYSKKDNLFYYSKCDNYNYVEKKYKTFKSFCKALNNNLEDCDLLDFDIENYDLKGIDYSKAILSSKSMQALGIYNNFLEKSIHQNEDYYTPITKEHLEQSNTKLNLVKPIQNTGISSPYLIENTELEDTDTYICYISDLHLDYKVKEAYPKEINKFELDIYMKNIVDQIGRTIPSCYHAGKQYDIKVIFVGDISFNFEIFKSFFEEYSSNIEYKTFFILGNHEVWDINFIKEKKNYIDIVEIYRNFLNSLPNPIILLENQLYFPNSNLIYNADDIMSLTKSDINKLFSHNGYAIFGALGFTMYKDSNIDKKVYKQLLIDSKTKNKLSSLTNKLHTKLKDIASTKKIFFATHIPKEDWSDTEYEKNWIYLNGHTHINKVLNNNDVKLYSDNQIGYYRKSFGLKYILTSSTYNIFETYKDGIYEIDRNQYMEFYIGIGLGVTFNRKYYKIYMIKKNLSFCFFVKLKENSNLLLLNGGHIKNVGCHDLNYFYENIDIYTNAVNKFLEKYSKIQKDIAKEVKSFGGEGTIHGCIIDIDYYNHLYLNPFDLKLTPYYATSMIDKYVYKNIYSLLKHRNRELFILYTQNQNLKYLSFDTNNNIVKPGTKNKETTIYSISRIIYSLQYTTNFNIIRFWDDSLLQENNPLIIKAFLESTIESIKKTDN